MPAYVPPARRQKQTASGSTPKVEAPPDNLRSPEEIKNHFWPVNEDGPQRFSESGSKGTLQDSAKTPGVLSYLILYDGANPRWESDKIIFSKSRLDLLPAEKADEPAKAPTAGEDEATAGASTPAGTEVKAEEESPAEPIDSEESYPIAVFKQIPKTPKTGRSYEFDGWYQIDRLTFLETGSSELVRTMEQKWTKTDARGNIIQRKRDQHSWEESLKHRWAVLKLKVDEAAQKELGKPEIAKLSDRGPDGPQAANMSVNEMLAAMRMGDAKEPAA